MAEEILVIRFLLDSQAEDMAYVDIEFNDERQAKKAMNAVISANGALVSIDNGAGVPVLLRSSHVIAAYAIDDDEFEDEEDEKDDGLGNAMNLKER